MSCRVGIYIHESNDQLIIVLNVTLQCVIYSKARLSVWIAFINNQNPFFESQKVYRKTCFYLKINNLVVLYLFYFDVLHMNPDQKVTGQRVSSHKVSKSDTMHQKKTHAKKVSGHKVSKSKCSKIWVMGK